MCTHLLRRGKGKDDGRRRTGCPRGWMRQKGTDYPVLKTDHSGEVAALGLIPGISVAPCEKSFGFFFRMTDEQKKEAAVYYTELLDMTLRKAVDGAFDLLVLDEIMAVMNYGLVREETVRDFITGRPPAWRS